MVKTRKIENNVNMPSVQDTLENINSLLLGNWMYPESLIEDLDLMAKECPL